MDFDRFIFIMFLFILHSNDTKTAIISGNKDMFFSEISIYNFQKFYRRLLANNRPREKRYIDTQYFWKINVTQTIIVVFLQPILVMEQNIENLRLIKKLERLLLKAIEEYRLIEENDRILIGLSGGKDSLALLDLLGHRMRIYKPRFSLVAAHISMNNVAYESDFSYLQQQTEALGIPFVNRETAFDASTDRRKSPCFLCSWYRRKALFDTAKEHGCNKIALGHHQDDILHTLLMNLTFQGSFSTMPPKLRMSKFDMTIIRPMCLISEKQIQELARIKAFRPQKRRCPYEHSSNRPGMKSILQQLEQMNPQARYSLWRSMTHIQPEYLPFNEKINVNQ